MYEIKEEYFIKITASEIQIGYTKDTMELLSIKEKNGIKQPLYGEISEGITWIFTIDDNNIKLNHLRSIG